jgi:hypothetical protein
MKLIITIISVLIFLSGLVWFLQGINILPGSYMTGDPRWTINGAIAMVASAVMFAFIRRRK